jgi:hypothetical protein
MTALPVHYLHARSLTLLAMHTATRADCKAPSPP